MSVKLARFLGFLTLFITAFVLFPLEKKQAQGRAAGKPTFQRASSDGDSHDPIRGAAGRFVVARDENGTVCRQMRADEAIRLKIEGRRVPLTDLSSGSSLNSTAQASLKITLRGTAQLNANAPAREAFLRAAARWESIVQTPITVVVDVDFGPTLFGEPYESPDIIGSSDAQALYSPTIYSAVRTALINGATNPGQKDVFSTLPTLSLGTDSGNATGVLTPSAIFRALNFINAIADPGGEAANFGPPPSIGFNSAFSYDFDSSDGIDADKTDFEAAALHELGHVLGFMSNVGSRELDPTFPLAPSVWDVFRFRPGVDLSTFSAAKRVLISGGEQVFFSGGQAQPLSTGRPDGTDGDQEQASHWKDDGFMGRLVGLMDPTLPAGRRQRISSSDVEALASFGYAINPATTVYDEYSLDDGSADNFVSGGNVMVVNRITPARYPAKIETLRLRLFLPTGAASPVGAPLRVVIFSDSKSTGQPPANPTFLYDATITIPAIPNSRFLDLQIPNGPSITGGDFYIGFQSASADVRYGIDTNAPKLASFVSPNNGGVFVPLRGTSGQTEIDLNLMARADVTQVISNDLAPIAERLSPSSVAPGEAGVALFVNGRNFQANSVVLWNGTIRPTTRMSASQLRATIPATDLVSPGTAKVSVSTPSSIPAGANVETGALNFEIGANRAAPSLTSVDPVGGAQGGPAFTLTVTGLNFYNNSVVRWNGVDRATTFVSGVKLTADIPATDLESGNNAAITVFTPGPGGGLSNERAFAINACSYALSLSSLTVGSGSSSSGVTVNTSGVCGWTASSDVSWLTLASTSGTGKSVVLFQVLPNTSVNGRSGTITIGGKQLVVQQLGLVASVSAASFVGPLAPESIGASFGAGLAHATVLGSTVPLPSELGGTVVTVRDANLVTRVAQLFFVSPEQINFLVPTGTAAGTATITVYVDGTAVSNGTFQVAAVAPSVFTANNSGSGVPAALVLRVRGEAQRSEDVAVFDEVQKRFVATPIEIGPEGEKVFLILFGTGIRGVASAAGVVARIGNVDAPVQFVGKQGSFQGQDQVNLEIPRVLAGRGDVTVSLTVNGRTANTVTVNIK